MILQVHDELVFDIPKDEEKIWEELVRNAMENVLNHIPPQNEILGHNLPPIRVDIHT